MHRAGRREVTRVEGAEFSIEVFNKVETAVAFFTASPPLVRLADGSQLSGRDTAEASRGIGGTLRSWVDESFDHFYLLIQGARCGLGIANVPRMLVRDDLMSGTLVAPMGFVRGANRLSIWTAPHHSHRPDVVKLVDWLHDELRATEP